MIEGFLNGYLTAALWSSHDESDESGGENIDRNYGIADIAPAALAKAREDCEAFLTAVGEHILQENCTGNRECTVEEYAGHDFWLTRAGHGCGFWDGDWAEPAASVLTAESKRFKEVDLYIGDDKQVRGFGE